MYRSIPHLGIVALFSLLGVSCASLSGPHPTPGDLDAAVDGVVLDSTTVDTSDDDTAEVEEPIPMVFEARSRQKVYGYYAWWTRGLWLDLDLSLFDKIFFFDLTPASDGSIRARNGYPFAWQGLIARADSFAVPVIPTLALLDADSLQALFLDPDHRNRLLETSLMLIEESGGAGLHLDYEWFAPATDSLREGFHAYVDTLAAATSLQYPDAQLSMFVPAFPVISLLVVRSKPCSAKS